MKKRILVISPEEEDKLTLVALIEGENKIKQVNSIVYYNQTIVVPSTYLRSPWMTNHIIAMQQNASCVMMLLPSNREFKMYSPNFANAFQVPTIGVVIQKDKESNEKVEDCIKELKEANLDNIVCIELNANEVYENLLKKIK